MNMMQFKNIYIIQRLLLSHKKKDVFMRLSFNHLFYNLFYRYMKSLIIDLFGIKVPTYKMYMLYTVYQRFSTFTMS
jgi:hypothetical protein